MSINDEHVKRLDNVFAAAGNGPEQKEFWVKRLNKSSAELAEMIISFFELFPGQIGWFKNLQERKEDALSRKDHGAWQAIIEEEKIKMAEIIGDSENTN